MVDIFTKEKRSYVMSRVKSKNTGLELKLRKELWKKGYRFRVHYKIKGNPDVVFPKQKLAIFIDGDFWHGYNWEKLKPKLKNEFWINKIKNNKGRDKKNNKILRKEGWEVIRFWGHEILKSLNKSVAQIEKALSR